jgi:hypothetical protein
MVYNGYVPLEKAREIIVINGSTGRPARVHGGRWKTILERVARDGVVLKVS